MSSSSSSSSSSFNILNKVKVKQAQFYYNENSFQRNFEKIPGYGTINLDFSNKLITGFIDNPSGYIPAIFYQTGLLTGIITDNVGSYTWENITISGTGLLNKVFIDSVTGFENASGIINFNTGLLTDGDFLSINDINFTYITGEPGSNFEFNNINSLVNILNSGATGALGFDLEFLVGVTGYVQNSTLTLFSYYRSGEDGNNVKIARFSDNNINGIQIPNRYFKGGETFRQKLNIWTGVFSKTFDSITIENSGFYIQKIDPIENFGNISGVVWEDNFDKNYTILTGFKNPFDTQNYSGSRILFNSGLNQFSGSTVLPQNLTPVYNGLNIEILKPNPYNINGNISEYIISGNNFIFRDRIEG